MSRPFAPLALSVAVSFALPARGVAQSAAASSEGARATAAAPSAALEVLDLPAYLRGDGHGVTADAFAARAVATAPSLASARAAVRQARAGAARAYLGFFPRFEVTARYTRLSEVTNPAISFGGSITPDQAALARMLIAGVDDPEAQALFTANLDAQVALATSPGFRFPVILNQFSFGGSLTYPLSDVIFAVLPGYEAAEAAVDASEAQARARVSEVAEQAREAYYNWARARAAHAVATSTIETIEAQARVVAASVEAGMVARVDLMRLEAQLASARVAAVRAEGGVAASAEALRTLAHGAEGVGDSVGEDLLAPLPERAETLDALVARAVSLRPEAEALRRAIAARTHAIAAAEGARLPHLLLNGAMSWDNPSQRVFPQRDDQFIHTWSLSAILSWSPNDFFTGEAQAEEARAGRAATEADLASLEDGLRMQVVQAFESYRASRAARDAAALGIAAAEEAVRVRTAQYQAGTATITELMASTADLARAQLDLVSAAIDGRIAACQLRRAIGEDQADLAGAE